MSQRVDCEDFSRDVSKIAVAKMCRNVGFEHVQSSAIETMADLVKCFLEGLGRDAQSLAETCGRDNATIHDILTAYCKMNPKFNLYQFGNKFLEEFTDNSFGYDVKDFPLSTIKESEKKADKGKKSWPVNAPKHLPCLPHPRTYKRTEIDVRERNEDEISKRKERLRQNRQTQMSLNRLKGSTFFNSSSSDDSNKRKRKWGAVNSSDGTLSTNNQTSSSSSSANQAYVDAPTKRLKKISESAVQKGLSEGDEAASVGQLNRRTGHDTSTGNSKHELVISGRYTE